MSQDTEVAEPITAKQLAKMCGTDPKTMRKFLRDTIRPAGGETPGQGGRYAFTPKQAKKYKKMWKAAQKAAANAPVEAKVKAAKGDSPVEAVDIEDLDIELDLGDEPSDEALEVIESLDDEDAITSEDEEDASEEE